MLKKNKKELKKKKKKKICLDIATNDYGKQKSKPFWILNLIGYIVKIVVYLAIYNHIF